MGLHVDFSLSKRELDFCVGYVETGNITKAALYAGYAERSAAQQGSRLMKKDKIRAEIERRQRRKIDRYEISNDRILRELALLGFSNIEDYVAKQSDGSVIVDFSTADRDQMAAVTSIEVEEYTEGKGENAQGVKRVKFKLADKRSALMDLAKIRRMLPADRVEHSGPNGGPIETVERIIDPRSLSHEQREQLRVMLLGTKRVEVTDVEDQNAEDDETE